jgi:hypothetical protein
MTVSQNESYVLFLALANKVRTHNRASAVHCQPLPHSPSGVPQPARHRSPLNTSGDWNAVGWMRARLSPRRDLAAGISLAAAIAKTGLQHGGEARACSRACGAPHARGRRAPVYILGGELPLDLLCGGGGRFAVQEHRVRATQHTLHTTHFCAFCAHGIAHIRRIYAP